MVFSDFVIIILLISCLLMWFTNLMGKCPPVQTQLPPQIIYKYRPELDLQFDPNNVPSKIYGDIFQGPNVYQGGYNLGTNSNLVKNKSEKK